MGFKASEAVSPLEYDFHPHVDAKGVTPEPSTDQIVQLQVAQKAALEKLGIDTDEVDNDDQGNMQSLMDMMAGLSEEQLYEIQDEQADAVAEVCGAERGETDADGGVYWSGGNPSRDEIIALPFRIRQAYFGWLMGQLFDPESAAAGTRPSLKAVRGGKRSIGRNAS